MNIANSATDTLETGINPFGRAAILRACSIEFDESTWARAEEYAAQGRVSKLEFNGNNTLTACVAGSAEEPYELRVVITRGRENLSLRGICNCPVRLNCKHVGAALLSWLDSEEDTSASIDAIALWHSALKTQSHHEETPVSAESVVVLYRLRQTRVQQDVRYEVAAYSARKLRSGGLGKSTPLSLDRRHFDATDLSSHDARICNALIGLKDSSTGMHLSGEHGYMVFRWMVETGNCYYEAFGSEPLRFDINRPIEADWIDPGDERRELKLKLAGSDESFVSLPTDPPWYIVPRTAQCGVIQTDVPSRFLAGVPFLPSIAEADAMRISELMVESIDSVDLPLPAAIDIRQIAGVNPRGVVVLTASKDSDGTHRYAEFLVDYDGARLPHMMAIGDEKEFLHKQADGQFVRVVRSTEAELALINEVRSSLPDWATLRHLSGEIQLHVEAKSSRDMVLWQDLIDGRLADLRRNGWIIERTPEFEFRVIRSREWQMNIDHSLENHWFDLDLNFLIDGQPISLIPVLASFIERVGPELPRYLNDPEASATVWLDEETLIEFPIAHIRPVLEVLVELHEHDDGKLRFSDLQSTVITDIADGIAAVGEVNLEWDVPARLAQILDRIRSFDGIADVDVPQALTADLRDYQRDGLNWLQFLREFGFSGILADDMGLGKTVQALATVLVEKQTGRCTTPSLVVAPTSLMGNWRREAEKFAPNLKVVVLHGAERSEHFEHLDDYDLLLTTYALLSRDLEVHEGREYHYLILDEAQAIKNPATKQAKAVCQVNAKHKLCLTGTPVENHLGEVWSQFRFLMPGFFGEQKHFNQTFRNPIEKSADNLAATALTKRLKPFILRRSKDAVASELPSKTEIIHRVALYPEQAVLYEGIRAAMETRVRRALAESGLGQSHITVLDALLRLRQTCLDPRLVKMSQARGVSQSAKLDSLMEMLPNFVEEGRRVLLFSQFTEMLTLIETEIQRAGISYTKLTGKTKKRDEAVDEFQSGNVSVFLISLKAGGTGLNLTQADTVILYDPWWNPAVENQAIDRAHRIGQDKPVFVYRMITEQTVEEKIVELQERKKQFANIVVENREENLKALAADDILELFSS
jgi:superfamily II DNA or RNA helicase